MRLGDDIGIDTSLRAATATWTALGLLSAGLVACAPNPHPLACAAAPSVSSPGPNTVDTISVKTAPGANVLTVAAFPAGKAFRTATANAAGLAKVAYPAGTAAGGRRVEVTVAVAKSGFNGACSTGFIPKAAPRPLTAAITWNVQTPSPLPSGSGACSAPNAAQCGTVVVTALIHGFSAYGGTPTCSSADPSSCKDYNGAVLSGQLELSWAISCSGMTSSHSDVQTALRPLDNSSSYKVTPVTRINADTAELKLTADLPFGPDVASCSQAPTLQSVTVSNVTLQLQGGGYPTSNFASAG